MNRINMWKGLDNLGIEAKCEYLPKELKFEVTVSKGSIIKTKKFPQSFTPTFGMDVVDMGESYKIAEELAKEVEKEIT